MGHDQTMNDLYILSSKVKSVLDKEWDTPFLGGSKIPKD